MKKNRDFKGFSNNQKEIYISRKNKLMNIKMKKADKLSSEGRFIEAEIIYRELIENNSLNSTVYTNLSLICWQNKNEIEASILLKKAIDLNPNDYLAYFNLGIISKEKKDYKNALIYFKKVILINPSDIISLKEIGTIYEILGDTESTIKNLKSQINLDPNNVSLKIRLAAQYNLNYQYESAISEYIKALNIEPNNYLIYIDLGNAYKNIGDLDNALNFYKKSLKINKKNQDVLWNMSLTYLLKGDYVNGWECFESRWLKTNKTTLNGDPLGMKCTKENFRNAEKLLIVSEQGLGDTIQFMRYIKEIKKFHKNIVFSCQTKLHNLVRDSGIEANPVSPEDIIKFNDVKWLPLLSIPGFLNVKPNNPISSKPYIRSNSKLEKKWDAIISKEDAFIIGINWQGNPYVEQNLLKGRSFKLDEFRNISKIKKTKLLSLQKGYGSEQLMECKFRDKFVSCQKDIDNIWDFSETAAIISKCNLVITSDTSVAHLSGALGKETWVLLQKIPDWRWGISSKETFWYPSVKLFRQNINNSWKEVMKNVEINLIQYLSDLYD